MPVYHELLLSTKATHCTDENCGPEVEPGTVHSVEPEMWHHHYCNTAMQRKFGMRILHELQGCVCSSTPSDICTLFVTLANVCLHLTWS